MRQKEIKNATIEEAFLGYESHGILTFSIGLDYGGTHQSFGDYSLGGKGGYDAAKVIKRILDTVGVNSWKKLIGTPVRVDAEFMKVHGIGNFLKDEWFYPEREYTENLKVE